MARYIDADVLIEMLNNKAKTDYEMGLYNHGALTQSFIRFVEGQPTADVVKVVRCKDCVAREEFAPNKFHCKNTGYYCGETGYCSDAVRTPQKEG